MMHDNIIYISVLRMEIVMTQRWMISIVINEALLLIY